MAHKNLYLILASAYDTLFLVPFATILLNLFPFSSFSHSNPSPCHVSVNHSLLPYLLSSR